MPLKKEEDRGTEKSLDKSSMKCNPCYQGGESAQKEITVGEIESTFNSFRFITIS
jgi:hypothetical protein